MSTIRTLIGLTERIEISLPREYNHTLFRVMHPDAQDSALEVLDTCAGAELLNTISEIRGLEELTRLTQPLSEVDASVHIVSPPTLIITLASAPADSK